MGENVNIEIGKGLNGLYFGMSKDEVKSKLGEPDEIYEYDYEGFLSTGYEYFSEEAEYEFDKEEGDRLYSITISNPSILLFGKPIIGESIETIRDLLSENGVDDFEEDDGEHDHEGHNHDGAVRGVTAFSDKLNSVFQFEENELVFFGFSPLFKDDTIDWPKY
ncbi:hypothetical protein KHM19_05360 [Leptospira borgpetersenii]|uniref:Uncharacterized protein n=4 Tax=Leptospira borgpetersenii TaxID=174 RepID=A0A0S2IRN9_LEPBO|nr:hypothetical protein LBBP_02009 [Leptospira borgpetersenii serovar Ballum]EKP14271.1 hypothetical protein LEP1GSC128_2954 [Leptospira borgpetersenii str. 200801926]EKQ91812.1 hypothetical protein LEP1GSC101_3464 [Leptospira borgpetersenii str. UI 09149]EKR02017.1 hypothetical protein LEP1GSC121_3887 [Leptospira borgpetersenii serovar Castellonis str. 200801910]EMK10267.1 hypothetical protein LEP1GSC066_3345 [Leptospira sp. serovar Kenya str. Sh9]EMN56832.1 hypothetical protein LEP1GSC090_11